MRLALSVLREIICCAVFVSLPVTMGYNGTPTDWRIGCKDYVWPVNPRLIPVMALIPPQTSTLTPTEFPPFMMYGVQESGRSPYSRVYLVTQSYELKVPWVAMARSRYFLPRSICSHGCLSRADGDHPLLPEGEREDLEVTYTVHSYTVQQRFKARLKQLWHQLNL